MTDLEAWVAEASHPVAEAFRYWRSCGDGTRLPSRQDINPAAIQQFLPNVLLVDVEPPRFRYRLVGTAVVAFRKGLRPLDPTGQYADEIAHQHGTEAVLEQYRQSVAARNAVYRSGVFTAESQHAGKWERLVMPLANDGERVNMLFVVFVRQMDDPQLRRQDR